MKTLLRHIKRSLVFRLLYRLVCWINYPTPRERMWHMFEMGKIQGRKMALQDLPIVQVQPKQATEPLHLPPGEWMKHYYQTHPEHRVAIPSSPLRTRQLVPPVEFVGDIEQVPTKKNLLDSYTTEEMPAIVKLLHEKRQEARNAG